MNYTMAAVLALAGALAVFLVWASVTEAPWETEGDTIIMEAQPVAPDPCPALYQALADAPERAIGVSPQAATIMDAIDRNGC